MAALNVIEREYFVHDAGLNCLGRHAKNHGGCFILGDDVAPDSLDGFHSLCSIVAHPRENHRDSESSCKGRDRFERDIGARTIAVDSLSRIEQDFAGRRTNADACEPGQT